MPATLQSEILNKLSRVHTGMTASPAQAGHDHYDDVYSPHEIFYEGTHANKWLEFSVSHRHQDGHVILGGESLHWVFKTDSNGDRLFRVMRGRDPKQTSFLRVRGEQVVEEGQAVEADLQKVWRAELLRRR